MKAKSAESLEAKKEREKEKREKTKKFISANVGYEPVFKGIPGTCSKIDIVNGLNYYAKIHSTKDSYDFLQKYIKKNHKELMNKLSLLSPDDITNKGFVIRMIENGFSFQPSNEEIIQSILNFIKEFDKPEISTNIKPQTEQPIKKRTTEFDELLNAVDNLIDNQTVPLKLEVSKDSDYKVVEKYLKEHLVDIEQSENIISINPDTGKEYKESGYLKTTVKRINQIYDYITNAIKSTKKTIIRKKTVKKIDPLKMISKLVFMKSKDEFKSINPVDIIGKKKLYIWDTKYRKLKCLISENELGFHVKGTTIINVDLVKSTEKSIKEKDVPALASNKNISGINNFFKNINGHVFPLRSPRVNEHQILLAVS